jgi:hypothetical protein
MYATFRVLRYVHLYYTRAHCLFSHYWIGAVLLVLFLSARALRWVGVPLSSVAHHETGVDACDSCLTRDDHYKL